MRFYSTAVMMLFLVFGSCRVWAAGQGFVQTGYTSYSVSEDGMTNRIAWTSLFYDHQGNPIRRVTVVSNYNDLDPNSLATVISTFNKDGELVNAIEEVDLGIDGTINRRVTTKVERLSATQTVEITEIDNENDSIVDERLIALNTFDKEGRAIHLVLDQIYIKYAQSWTSVHSWNYSEDRSKFVTHYEADLDGDGDLDVIGAGTDLKNNRGQVFSSFFEFDFIDGSGTTFTFDSDLSYDRHGNQESRVGLVWVNDMPDDTSITTYSYQNRGAVRQQSRVENQVLDVMRQRLRGGPSRLFQCFISQAGRGGSKN